MLRQFKIIKIERIHFSSFRRGNALLLSEAEEHF